ncbi:AAA family ATPase [Flavobacterium limi]|uniref:TIGR02646 family protein n=1 Tax=Flavobacterium limi TaxID=2045105 RepID=A0ABQ1UZF7_9FLAO|nr:AAA family ATPase [Flavobacterium limi]GGF30273.1 hypothetical protein GCM10011518_44400 [Flavobacterium limi]
MIYIDRNSFPVPEIFQSDRIKISIKRLEEFYMASDESKSQRRFSRPFEVQILSAIREPLFQLFNKKCAYCESLIATATSTGAIDHFRPKSSTRGLEKDFAKEHYWWLSYEWRNMYSACDLCNRYKANWFPVEGKRVKLKTAYEDILVKENALLLDPCNDRPEEHLIFDEQGKVDFLSLKGKTTIEILKLNREELVNARQIQLRELYSEWELFTKLYRREKSNRRKIKTIVENWDRLFTQFSELPYLGILRFMLSKWIDNRPEIQEYLANGTYNDEILEELKSHISLNLEHFEAKKELNEEEKQIIEDKLNIKLLKHIYIQKIEINNFKCFSNIEIDFEKDAKDDENVSNEDLKGEPWLLFLGENGVGKSSVLKALVIGLSGNEYLKTLDIKGKDILKHDAEEGFIRIYLVNEDEPIKVDFNEREIISSIDLPIVNLLAYNSIRLSPKKGKLIAERNKFENVKVKNLFDYSVSLIDADKWLLGRPKKVFDRVALTLKDLMMLEDEDKIEIIKGVVSIVRNNDVFTVDELSDGYQSVYSLAVDIMATFVSEKTSFDLVEGMVLIDEIGIHLHPRWRMQVVDRLRKAFPKINFVVTTHEPLCLRGLRLGETVVLTKDSEKEVIAITELPDPSELRIDQILTSDFFGLNSTIDPETEKLFEEYYQILALDDVDRSNEQKNQLLYFNKVIPKIKHLGDSLREELIYYVVDELLAKKTRKEGLRLAEALKKEALERVESLWKLIESENN